MLKCIIVIYFILSKKKPRDYHGVSSNKNVKVIKLERLLLVGL